MSVDLNGMIYEELLDLNHRLVALTTLDSMHARVNELGGHFDLMLRCWEMAVDQSKESGCKLGWIAQ
tara:strand:- start:1803 stop:2003 length:201 start_codon:yes stop_codon:yes gene_type:complete